MKKNNVKQQELNPEKIPQHIAIIMDGNGRWAKNRKFKRLMGHRRGAEKLIDILNVCKKLNVKILSVFAFSTENWNRPEEEVKGLMNLLVEFFNKKFDEIIEEKIKVIHTGILEGFPEKVKDTIKRITKETENFSGNSVLNIVLNYGGRLEIVDTAKKLAAKVLNGELNINDINENVFTQNLYHPELPEPELLIRTSGEMRISNFLLWELAYTEFWFTDTYWPDLSEEEFIQAIYDYQNRERRFGKIN